MKIQKCRVCDKPFFQNPSTTDYAYHYDPEACPQCNAKASEYSQAPIKD